MKFKIQILFLVTVLCFQACKAQNNVQSALPETEKITKYLENTIEYSHLLMASQKVLAIDIIKTGLTISFDKRSDEILQEQYFIKSDNKLTPYKTLNDMLSSNEFIENLKSKKYKLNTEQDGAAFQSMLTVINPKSGLGFFKENNIWYFVRSKFFSDIEVIVVSTDKKGQITSVVYKKKLRKEVPAKTPKTKASEMAEAAEKLSLFSSDKKEQGMDLEKRTISKKDSTYMHNYLLDDLNYFFEVSPHSLNSVNKIATISVYKCALKITDEVAIGRRPFLLVVNNNEYTKQPSGDMVLKMPLFLKSLQEKYKLKTEEDARLFMNLLDDLELFRGGFYDDIKTFYKKENMWIFVRKKGFDGLEGYILKVDKNQRISYIEYIAISDENIARIKKIDPNFKVD